MQIRLNGQLIEAGEGVQTISDLLAKLGYAGQTLAVAVNQNFLPRSQYATRSLEENLDIEIVSPMAGG
jgi:sulfur carrier protein